MALLEDDFSPTYRAVRDSMDGARWNQTLAAARRPSTVQTPDDVRSLVGDIAPRYGVDPRLVESVIGLESSGQPGALARKGAQGLMQLMPATARRFGVSDPFDPAQNIEGGVRYLAWLRDQFPGRTDLQLAAYHAGEGAVRAAGYAIPDASDGQMRTRDYVQTILNRYQPTLPGEGGRPGLDLTSPLAREAVRTNQPGPTLTVETDPQRLAEQGRLGKPATPLPGQGGLPALDVSREVQQRPMALPGTELQVEADVSRLSERARGQPTALPPGQRPWDREHWHEVGLTEDRGGRILGNIATGAVGMLENTLQSVVAAENLVGLKRPDVPGMPDPMGIDLLTPVLKQVEEAVEPRLGAESPDFVDQLANAVGTSLVSLAPGAGVQRFFQGVAKVAPTLARWGGAVTSAIIEASGEAGQLFAELKPLVGEDEAAKRAAKSFAANAVLVTATDKLGIFGEEGKLLRRTLNGVITNGLQEAVQYEIERRQLWVPASTPGAEQLTAHGWQREGDRFVKPFDPKDMGEAALIGMVIGGSAAAGVGTVVEGLTPWQQVQEREREAAGGTIDPQFSILTALEAAQHPDTPREGVEPATWQRWAQYLYDTVLPPGQGGGGILSSQRGAVGLVPSLRTGAEGLTPARYRTPSGDWRIPLRDIPTRELELKDMIRQQGGVKLAGEELHGELQAVISRTETGLSGLQNNSSGASLQQMAEKAHELGFTASPDKASLLEALDRSVTQGLPVYSVDATGQISLLDDPHVQAGYQAVLDAVAAMPARTAEQVGGVRHRQAVHEEARQLIASGQWTLDDVREIFPNTTLNDTMASALLVSLNTVGEQMAVAAQQYLDGGERIGSREEARLQELMALLAELDPYRLGVSAAQSRGLGILNDPLSGYTQYLNALHKTLQGAPERTMGQIARRILASRPEVALSKETLQAHPELLADLFAEHYAMVERFQDSPLNPLEPGVQQPLFGRQAELQPVNWAAVRQAIDRFNAMDPLDPLRPQQQQELFSLLLGRQWDQAGYERLAAYLADHADADTLQRLSQVLRPWEAQNPQLSLFQALAQTTRPGFQDYFLELWFNALLSNPGTHVANALSNTVTTVWALPERFLAEQYAHGQEGHVARGESTAMLYGLVHGIQDAWAGAVRSWQQGAPVSGLGRETTKEPVATAANLGLDPNSAMGQFADFFFNYIGLASGGRLPSRGLMASDEFFKMLNYRMELNALAYREAVRQGYEGSAWAEHVAQVVSSPQLGQLQQSANEFSVLQTFQQDLTGTVGQALQGVANMTVIDPLFGATLPVGRILVPFVQTPANIARYAMERTPMGQFFASHQADLAAGGSRADIAKAKVTLGTAAMLVVAGMAMKGWLVGRGPEDPELRAIWLESHPEYSVRIPGLNKWMSYDRLDPLGMLLGMTADMFQIAGEVEINPYSRVVVAPLYAFMKNIGSKTYMQGLSRFFDAMSSSPRTKPGTFGTNVARWGERMLAGLLQPSALVAATARAFDPAEKEAEGLIDDLYARVPGWRSEVPSRRTLGGEKIIYGWGFSPDILANTVRAYWPLKLGERLIYPADREILDNKMALGKPARTLTPHALPVGQQAQGVVEVDQSDLPALRLTAQQYEKLSVLAGGNQAEAQKLGVELPAAPLQALVEGLSSQFAATPPQSVLSLDDYLDWARQQPEYRDASPGPGGGKEAIFKRAVLAYREVGRQLLLAQEDELRERYNQSKIQQQIQRIPLGERPAVEQQLQQGYREAAPQVREALGLRVGAPR